MHDWSLPTGKISFSFKTMKNIKIADPVVIMNSFYDKDDILQKKSWDIIQIARFKGISFQLPLLATQN